MVREIGYIVWLYMLLENSYNKFTILNFWLSVYMIVCHGITDYVTKKVNTAIFILNMY
jgi:hypothetical protein